MRLFDNRLNWDVESIDARSFGFLASGSPFRRLGRLLVSMNRHTYNKRFLLFSRINVIRWLVFKDEQQLKKDQAEPLPIAICALVAIP